MSLASQTISAQTIPSRVFLGQHPALAKLGIDSVFMVSDTVGVASLHPNYIFVETVTSNCKSKMFLYGRIEKYMPATGYAIKSKKKEAPEPFLKVHGSLMYEGYYQSNIDTPYVAKDIYQHTIQAGLDVTAKDKYPFRVYFTTRFSNASFIQNITDLNVQFNNPSFKNGIYQNLENWERKQLSLNDSLNRLDSALFANRKKLDSLRGWLSNPAVLQQLVEAREKAWLTNKLKSNMPKDSTANKYDSLVQAWQKGQHRLSVDDALSLVKMKNRAKADSTKDSSLVKKYQNADSSMLKNYEAKRKRLDTLQRHVDSLQKMYLAYKSKLTGSKDSIINHIEQLKNPDELASSLKSLHLPDTVLPQGYKKLLALRSFSVGRSTVNYSELTVKNISLEGVQAEYNPSWYLAVAAGTVNYRFRDFVVNENPSQQQYVMAVRVGTGMKEGSHFFVTYYTGKKQVYNYSTDSAGNILPGSPGYNLMGVSIEKRWQLSKTTSVVGEVAKSSVPYYSGQAGKPSSLLASTFGFNDRSNEAYSIKLATMFPKTQTKISAYYKKFGANFQSFSMFTTSSQQNAWSVKVDQPFFKKQLTVSASVKDNDFTNPYINQAFYSNVVFKSISATLRRKKWPVLSLGYYPSSQLTSLGNNQYTENLFYTLVGTASHSYKYKGVLMSTILSYTRFYNKAADSGFVYYNTQNLLLGQSIFLQKFTFQVNLSGAENGSYNLYTADGNIQYKMFKWLTVGGGVKYNQQTVIDNKQVGYSANTTIRIPKLGEIQFLAQKAYIPGMNQQLVENNIGRLMYYKTF